MHNAPFGGPVHEPMHKAARVLNLEVTTERRASCIEKVITSGLMAATSTCWTNMPTEKLCGCQFSLSPRLPCSARYSYTPCKSFLQRGHCLSLFLLFRAKIMMKPLGKKKKKLCHFILSRLDVTLLSHPRNLTSGKLYMHHKTHTNPLQNHYKNCCKYTMQKLKTHSIPLLHNR